MKLLSLLLSLVPHVSGVVKLLPKSAASTEYDASLVMPSWEEHPRAREFRRNREPDLLRDYYRFR